MSGQNKNTAGGKEAPNDKEVSNEEKTLKQQIRSAMTTELRSCFRSETDFAMFFEENQQDLQSAVDDMYSAYERDGELEDLKTAELNWYREFLYDHVTLPDDEGDEGDDGANGANEANEGEEGDEGDEGDES